MNMQLFSRFIPNIEATAQVENLQNMVEQVREMQAEIRENLELAAEYVEMLFIYFFISICNHLPCPPLKSTNFAFKICFLPS